MGKNKVVVTGFDMITSLGLDYTSTWQALLQGKSGVSTIDRFDTSMLETHIAACVPEVFNDLAAEYIKKRQQKQMTRVTQMALVASKKAVANAQIDFSLIDSERVAVIVGLVNTSNNSTEDNGSLKNKVIREMPNAVPAWISLEYNIEGPAYVVSTACASSAYALAQGAALIQSGQTDVAIIAGADSIVSPEDIEGFNALFALSTRNDDPQGASRPFSPDRDGFVIGEGAGAIILESEAHAQKRRANIWCELAGFGLNSEAYNIMMPKAEGKGMQRVMEIALKNAGVDIADVQYINTHGTSTTLNDLFETTAIRNLFHSHADQLLINSSKSMLGHTIAAAGVIEGIVSILSLVDQKVHPTLNFTEPDPDIPVPIVAGEVQSANLKVAISNSFAFGGHNACVVFRKRD